MGGGGSKSTTQQQAATNNVTQVTLPPWVDAAGQENVAEAARIAKKPYEGYEGTVVPDLSQMTEDTLQWIRQNAGI
jgi:hypothetical protein